MSGWWFWVSAIFVGVTAGMVVFYVIVEYVVPWLERRR